MNPAKLQGKSLPEIRALLKDAGRDELIAVLASLATVEPLFRPSEIAVLCKKRRRDVLAAIKAKRLGDYFCFGANSLAVPASGVNAWRDSFRVRASNGKELG